MELDAREEALAERESALGEREKALAEKEKAMGNARTIPLGVQGQTPDPAQVQAERDKRIQQLPAGLRALIPDRAQMDARKAEKDRLKQQQLSQGQGGPKQLERQRQSKFEAMQKWQMSGAAVSPAAEAASPTPSPAEEDTSSGPSSTPE